MENQTQPPQNRYPYDQSHYDAIKKQSTVSTGDWLLTLFLMILPVVNLIMLLVWAFGGGISESKANWAKATLIFYLVSVPLGIIILVFIAVVVGISIPDRYRP
jgi:hypothetical protein